jgi:zinc transport system substrate-binding protein
MTRPLSLGLSLTIASAFALPASAEVPQVATDIPPVHSLVSMVMEGLGTPDALIRPGESAHHLALRPSQARSLSEADLVVWVGPSLTPALEDQIEALAPEAVSLELSHVTGVHALPFRESGLFPHEEDHGDEHAEEDHGEDAHAGADDHHEDHDDDHADDHAEEHDDHADDHAHADGAADPHMWLAPENAILWLPAIAQALSELDPENAETYRANAAEGVARIAAADGNAATALGAVQGAVFGVFHDAFHYFEESYGLRVVGAIVDSDEAAPGATRMDLLRDVYAETPPVCFLAQPGADERLIAAVMGEAAENVSITELDPLGADLAQGADLYPALIEDLATRIAACASK